MKKLAIIGSRDLGQLIAYHAHNDKQYEVVGFFDDYASSGDLAGNFPILGKLEDIEEFYNKRVFDEILIGIGYKHLEFRNHLWKILSSKIPFANLLHSSSYIDASCTIGKGVVILPGCTLDRNVSISDNVLLNTGCVIAHDSSVKHNVFLAPGVTIAGFVTINKNSFLGIGSIVIDNVTTCEGMQTGGGTVIIKDIKEAGLYVGNPARFIR